MFVTVLLRTSNHYYSDAFPSSRAAAIARSTSDVTRYAVTLLLCHYRASGFADDMSTYGMVSGLWASFFSLGAFVGPSVAGILYDTVGFRSGTLFPVGMHVLVVSWQTAKCLYVLAHEGIAFSTFFSA